MLFRREWLKGDSIFYLDYIGFNIEIHILLVRILSRSGQIITDADVGEDTQHSNLSFQMENQKNTLLYMHSAPNYLFCENSC